MSMKKTGRPASLAHRPRDLLAGEHEPLRAGRGDHDVHLRELALHGIEADGTAPEAVRQRLGAVERAVGHDDLADAPARSGWPPSGRPSCRRRGGGSSGPRGRRRPARRARRPPTRRRQGSRRSPSPSARACRPAAPGGRAGGASGPVVADLAAGLVGLAHLAEDLRLAGHHRVEAGGDPEEVEGGGLVGDGVERGRQLRLREAGEAGELRRRCAPRPPPARRRPRRPRCGCTSRARPPRYPPRRAARAPRAAGRRRTRAAPGAPRERAGTRCRRGRVSC